MDEHDRDSSVAAVFEQNRPRLVALGTRMLGSRADAEDAVQEAWLRLARSTATDIENLAGWLTTVVSRVCLDFLRSRATRAETSYDDWLPDLVVTEEGVAPEDEALLAESVGFALLVVLDTLTPAERLAFVLHDMFGVPFSDIGRITGRSADAAKMLASRARRTVQQTPRGAEDRSHQRALVDAFLAAGRQGDFAGLLELLDPELVWREITPRGLTVKIGATEVAARAERGSRAPLNPMRVSVNGDPGLLAFDQRGRPLSLMVFSTLGDQITEIISITDPTRLSRIPLPGPRSRPGTTPSA